MRLIIALLTAFPLLAESYLFTSFRSNGETGLFLAASSDGKTWTPLNGDKSWLKPEKPGELMRDPWLGRGPDGVWHLLWTWGWTKAAGDASLKIGHATSKDLLQWTAQEEIPVLRNEPAARNAWAPEAVWDDGRKEWTIFWATTIPGRFPNTEQTGDSGYNHRLYSMTTKDWKTFTPAKLFFDPGFNAIDSTIVQDGKRWVMIFKDERKSPVVKALKVAFADSPAGPWRDISEPFTPAWNEGPTAVRVGNEWWIYFDHYQKPQHYGAVKTTDWKQFTDITEEVHFPAAQRHGTVVKISDAMAAELRTAVR